MTEDLVNSSSIAQIAGVSPSTVANWKRRHSNFPRPVERSTGRDLYLRNEIDDWLLAQGIAPRSELSPVFSLLESLRHHMKPEDAAAALLAAGVVAKRRRGRETASTELELAAVLGVLGMRHHLATTDGEGPPVLLDVVERVGHLFRSGDLTPEGLAASIRSLPPERGWGEAMDPRGLSLLQVLLVQPRGVLYDPCAGWGNTLALALRSGEVAVAYGQEINPSVGARARLCFELADQDVHLEFGDTLADDAFPDLKADTIVANPPFGLAPPETLSGTDPRWGLGVPTRSTSTEGWIQHVLHHLSVGGRAAIVVPPGTLFSGAGRIIRNVLVRSGDLEGIIALPSGVFSSTQLAAVVMVFARGATRSQRVVMVDAARESVSRRSGGLTEGQARQFAETYLAALTGTSPPEHLVGDVSCGLVDVDQIAANDFNLQPSRYLAPSVVARPLTVEELDSTGGRLDEALSRMGAIRHLVRVAGESSQAMSVSLERLKTWPRRRVGDVVEIQRRSRRGSAPDDGQRSVAVIGFREGDLDEVNVAHVDLFDQRLMSGDVLLCVEGPMFGQVGVWIGDQVAVASPNVAVLRPAGHVRGEFLAAWFSSNEGQAELGRRSTTGSFQRLTSVELERTLVPVPPLSSPDAEAVVRAYDAWLSAVRAATKALDELNGMSRWLMELGLAAGTESE